MIVRHYLLIMKRNKRRGEFYGRIFEQTNNIGATHCITKVWRMILPLHGHQSDSIQMIYKMIDGCFLMRISRNNNHTHQADSQSYYIDHRI
ncbi:hypothetical protein SDC9_147050 [bioreactor metagenome]|uniref:Uncharacterized protein n=1 Tax=bioreactor metagenome TaxID=1076179 RepID=A0A645EEK7_9ZZZZ